MSENSHESHEKQADVRILTTEEAVVEMLEEDGEKTEQQKNLAIAQARRIGDLDMQDDPSYIGDDYDK